MYLTFTLENSIGRMFSFVIGLIELSIYKLRKAKATGTGMDQLR